MRKFINILIAAAAVLAAMIFAAGCGEETKDALEVFKGKYEKIGEATVIERTIEISNGDLVKYVGSMKLEKTSDGYKVTENEKKRGTLDEQTDSQGFVVAPQKEYTVNSVTDQTYAINFSREVYDDFEVTESGLKATAKSNNVKEILGRELGSAAVDDFSLEIATDDAKVNSVTITYTTNGDDVVSIVFKFSY